MALMTFLYLQFYKETFQSRGDASLSRKIVELLQQAGISARTLGKDELRGKDGRGFMGYGIDHGVFVPFKVMFGDSMDIPVVQVSIDGSLSPEKNWALGRALSALRSERILLCAGGLTVHDIEDLTAMREETANARVRSFNQAVTDAVLAPPASLRSSLTALVQHPNFREAHPTDEHFIPIYIAAGAGTDGAARIISSQYGMHTIAFGV